MDKQEYINYLTETSEKVSPVILEVFEPYRNIDKKLYEIAMFFVNNRLNRPLLKPALLRASYELCGGREWGKIIPACVAFELINISSYQANSAFDNKLGILTDLQKESQFIASMISREVAFKCLALMENDFTSDQILKVSQCLSESNRYIYIAQHWDINLLTFENHKKYLDQKKYLEEYEKRCFFGSGIFTGLCAYTGGMLAGGTQSKLSALKNFGEQYGLALHMINDIGDYVPTFTGSNARRDYQDQFSDFKNQRLTLPLHHLLAFADSGDIEVVTEMLSNKRNIDEDAIFKLILKAGSLDYTQKIARRYMREAKDSLNTFGESYPRDILSMMASSIKSNKYHYAVSRAKQVST